MEGDLFEFEFKAKSSYLGCLYSLPSKENAKLTIKSGSLCEDMHINIKEGHGEIKLDTMKFKGVISYEIFNDCFFTFLENVQLELENKPRIKTHSKQMANAVKGIARRITYNLIIYYADTYSDYVQISEDKLIDNNLLPKGWERRFLENGRAYYINHNKNYTQWKIPDDPGQIQDIYQQSNQFRIRSSQLNIFGLFDFNKFKIVVLRTHVVQSTADLFLTSTFDKFERDPLVIFVGEIGEDWGALLREFFYKASLELLNDERIKCIGCVNDVRTIEERKIENHKFLQIHLRDPPGSTNSASQLPNRIFSTRVVEALVAHEDFNDEAVCELFAKITTDSPFLSSGNTGLNILPDRDFFTYVGIFTGLAYSKKLNINMDMSLAFYENLLKREFNLSHIQDVQVQKSISYINSCDLAKEEVYDEYNNVPLTEENRKAYVNRLVQDIVYLSRKKEYDWIREGFYMVISKFIVDYIGTYDLMFLLSGSEEITYEMLCESVNFIKCNGETKEIRFLLEILKNENEDFLRRFLQYVTGAAAIPIGSIKSMKFKWYVEKTTIKDMLFKASTCINRLYVGCYNDIETMKRIMLYSMQNTEGFHKV